jgi:membrane protease YdiL (CAAX protease family)
MSDPANDPPLVTRPPEQPPAPAAPPAPRRPRPGFWEAVVWCLVFLAGQVCGALAAVVLVVAAYTLAAPNPGQFINDQLDGFARAVDPKAPQDDHPAVPFAFGQALAWGMLAAQFVSLGLIALVLPRRVGPDWKRQLGVRQPAGLHVLLVLLIVPGFLIIAGVIEEATRWATGLRPSPAMKALNGVFGAFPWPLTVLAVAIGPGVVEEFWCRGFLGRGLCARYGLVTGVLLTSILFALMHGDPALFLPIALMGAYLHFVYLATRCIWAPILLHAMNNGISILLALTLKPEQLDQEKQVPLVVSVAALALLIFGSVALWTSRAELQPGATASGSGYENDHSLNDRSYNNSWEPEYPGVSAPPPEANVRIGYAIVSPVAMLFTLVSFALLMYLGYRFLI